MARGPNAGSARLASTAAVAVAGSARTGLVRSYEVTEPVPFTTPLTEELEVERSWAGLTELAAGRALL